MPTFINTYLFSHTILTGDLPFLVIIHCSIAVANDKNKEPCDLHAILMGTVLQFKSKAKGAIMDAHVTMIPSITQPIIKLLRLVNPLLF